MWLTTMNRGFPMFGERNYFEDLFGPIMNPEEKIKTENGKHHITVVAPGLSKSDFNIEVQDGRLIVSYDVSDRNDVVIEQKKYRRSWRIPNGVETSNISASYKQGILTILVPEQKTTSTHKIKIE